MDTRWPGRCQWFKGMEWSQGKVSCCWTRCHIKARLHLEKGRVGQNSGLIMFSLAESLVCATLAVRVLLEAGNGGWRKILTVWCKKARAQKSADQWQVWAGGFFSTAKWEVSGIHYILWSIILFLKLAFKELCSRLTYLFLHWSSYIWKLCWHFDMLLSLYTQDYMVHTLQRCEGKGPH